MPRSGARVIIAALTAAALTLVTWAATPAPASATPLASTPGSLVYVQDGDVWLSTPDGTTKRQVTHDGGTPTPDGTGATGYLAPSESDGGVVAAVRNQSEASGTYLTGYVRLMDRSGHVSAVLHPQQSSPVAQGGSCPGGLQQVPRGIVNAVISPDGQHIAYTEKIDFVDFACGVSEGYDSWIADADGSDAHEIKDSGGDASGLEIGQWASSTRLLVARTSFGSVEDFYVDLPGSTATHWVAPAQGDLIDSVYGQPDVRSGILATSGYSEYTERNAVRLWTTSGFGTPPSPRCDYASPVDNSATGEILTRPSISPDGGYVVWEDSKSDGTVAQTGQGIYVLPTSTISSGCSTSSSLLIQSGKDPFWANAGLYAPPSVAFTPTPSAESGPAVSIGFTVTDDAGLPVTTTCTLDGGSDVPCTSPYTRAQLSEGAHILEVNATDGQQSGSAQVTWHVDATPPTVQITGPAAPVTLGGSTTVTWNGGDGGSGLGHYELRESTTSYSGQATAWSTPQAWSALSGGSVEVAGLQAGTDCFQVRGVDKAGNASEWSSSRCTAVPLDDRALKASHGWHPRKGSKYFAGTASVTKARHATLSLAGAALDRVGVVATECKKCGTLGVYVGARLIGKVRLRSAHTQNQVVTLLPAFAAGSGTVRLKVLTKGKQVAVDGLVVSAA